jgi:hypothetical protein
VGDRTLHAFFQHRGPRRPRAGTPHRLSLVSHPLHDARSDGGTVPPPRPAWSGERALADTPLENGLLETERGADGIERPRPPFVEGIFWTGGPDGENIAVARRYDRPFTLDAPRGIVRFAQPVVKRNTSDNTFTPADLYLTVAHPLHEQETRHELRFTFDRPLPGGALGTGPLIVRRDDLAETLITVYSTSRSPIDARTNHEELTREAERALDAAEGEFQTLLSADIEYAGLVPIAPDGAIQQVAWSGGPRGAVIRASRNQEFSFTVPSWKERRAAEAGRLQTETARRLLRAQTRLLRGDR